MLSQSLSRFLSSLMCGSPIFDHGIYGKHVLLGGDFNIFANPRPDDPGRKRHFAVLSRLEAYGLIDCLNRFKRPRSEAVADPCPCGVRACRRHWRTFRRSPGAPGLAYQEDYLFASRALAVRCTTAGSCPSSPRAITRRSWPVSRGSATRTRSPSWIYAIPRSKERRRARASGSGTRVASKSVDASSNSSFSPITTLNQRSRSFTTRYCFSSWVASRNGS